MKKNDSIDWHNDQEIKNIVFTEEFLKKEKSFISVFQDIFNQKIEGHTTSFQIYENGRLLTCQIELTTENQEAISKVIKNIEAFFLYQKAINNGDNSKIDLAVIFEFMAYNGLGYIKYDRDNNKLYYDQNCTDF